MTGTLRNVGLLAFGLIALVQTGCIAAVAGVAGVGAVAGYAYYNGRLYRDYRASLPESLVAVRTALANQKFTIDRESADAGSALIQTKTADEYTIRVHVESVPSPVPGDGPITRIGVRVGFSGDEAVSARVLDEISRLLPGIATAPVAPPVSGFVPNPAPGPASFNRPVSVSPSPPGPVSTTAPPLAGSSPIVPTTTPANDPGRLVPIPVTAPGGSR